MTADAPTDLVWSRLLESSNEFTCYSAALAGWLAPVEPEWAAELNPGLWLRLSEQPGELFGFAYFPPHLRRRLGLVRTGAGDASGAVDGVLAELERSGRVIVAGDGFHLQWHVAYQRAHTPHWFLLTGTPERVEVADPFACRNELGTQTAARLPVTRAGLAKTLEALPGDEPVHRLREVLAFGDEAPDGCEHRHQWFVRGEVPATQAAPGIDGPAAIRLLAAHFRTHGQDLEAYRQADDIWSIARHRAFLLSCARRQGEDAGWAERHLTPLARRWGHVAPLLMQAVLSLRAGRSASPSVPEALERLADMEAAASCAAPRSFLERIKASG